MGRHPGVDGETNPFMGFADLPNNLKWSGSIWNTSRGFNQFDPPVMTIFRRSTVILAYLRVFCSHWAMAIIYIYKLYIYN
jgi:hypothetical protein